MSSGYFDRQIAGTGLNNPLPYAVKTAAYAALPADTGTLFVTDGAAVQVSLTLPPALKALPGLSGLRFGFRNSTTFGLVVKPVGSDVIQFPGQNTITGAAGGQISTVNTGAACWLHCTQDGVYNLETGLLGTWTVT